jgi:hypothetical protein
MPPLVRSLLVKGFRSLANVRIDFDNPTFLVWRNGSGKSNIGDALRFMAEAMNSPVKEVIDRRGGVSSVRTKFARRGFPRNLGLGIVGGVWEDLRDFGIRGHAELFRYSFEIGPVADYDVEILREQCAPSTQPRHKIETAAGIRGHEAVDFFLRSPFSGEKDLLYGLFSRLNGFRIGALHQSGGTQVVSRMDHEIHVSPSLVENWPSLGGLVAQL